ncbi:MAG: hypothetical protein MJ156_01565 [Alphaproteobacteria bacterium]|nr:hypothetical protein [Alphaproteobacteria bacterium]
MKKSSILTFFTGIVSIFPFVSDAAYPVYNGYRPNGVVVQQPANNAARQLAAASRNNGRPMARNVAATQPTRVTGALPRVGSSATNAGRQYYQQEDYDRLAESGLYVGLSAGYAVAPRGTMVADYAGDTDSFLAPGAFQEADFNKDTVIPLQVSVGAAINSDFRVDFSYLRYSGLSYPSTVSTSDGAGGYINATVSGGAITANATMLNVYYNIDSFTGYMAGGSLRPYIGAGVGLSLNSLADYVVYDGSFYSENDPAYVGAGTPTGVSDIYAYHNGGTMEQFAFALEAGVTTEMNEGLKLDFFVRYANLGLVKSSGSIVVSQTEWLADGAGGEYEAPYDSVYHYTNWFESGRLSTLDVGARLRLQF